MANDTRDLLERQIHELGQQLLIEKQKNRQDKLAVARLQQEVARHKSERPLVCGNVFLFPWGLEVVLHPILITPFWSIPVETGTLIDDMCKIVLNANLIRESKL